MSSGASDAVWYHLCTESKKYNKLVNKTKKKQTPRERTNQWREGRREGQYRGSGLLKRCRRHRRRGFNPWVQKIPWRRKWQSTPVFFPQKISQAEEPAGYRSKGLQRVGTQLSTHSIIYNEIICMKLFKMLPLQNLKTHLIKEIIFKQESSEQIPIYSCYV